MSVKKILFSVLLLIFNIISILNPNDSNAQTKVGYIDSKKIIDNMQEARDAKMKLDNLVSDWQRELSILQDSLRLMKEDYEKKKLIMTDQMKAETEKRIKDVENSIETFRQSKFGENGEYFQKQNEFMKPVYDKIFKAIEIVAKREDFDYVFDRSSSILLLYVNEKYDITFKVQRVLEGKD
ncbi:MAG: OmpH family outer membrane protein [Ignavibacteria bacterium]|nr:OmpH family outer membrane protein [Ignavibacteria bacterium]